MTQSQVQPVVVDTSNSPHAQLRPVAINAVKLTDKFWSPRQHTNHSETLPQQFEQLESSHRLDNFRRVSGKIDRPFEAPIFNDTDVYKWLEAAAWTLANTDDPDLERMVDIAISEIADSQQPDGYIHSYFSLVPAERWSNLRDLHEMYNAGHLIQAAVAHYRSTGSHRLLDIASRFADLICDTFGPVEEGKRVDVDGHEEVEMALVELARATGNDRYRAQAQFFVDIRGRGVIGGRSYHQDHTPFRELGTVDGHAVRAVYYTAGGTDLFLESGEAAMRDALDRMWQNMVERRMYVSGGIGARHDGEAFGKDYELGNERAYNETCAAIGSMMWNWRMLAIEGDARYSDLIELQLYNGMLPGLSLDGRLYFYENPLEDDGTHRRTPWFGCACCPPNVARTLASLGGYVYSTSERGVWVHLYAGSEASLTLADGSTVGVTQRTNYPWDGDIAVEIDGEGTWSLFLRVPAWCRDGARIEINGEAFDGDLTPGTYAEINRAWKRGDVVRLALPMQVERLVSNPNVLENRGRVAIMRGPLLYCVEQADNPGIDPRNVVVSAKQAWTPTEEPDLLGGVTVLRTRACEETPAPGWEHRLYRVAETTADDRTVDRDIDLVAIPYYAWANRKAGRMQVWLRST